MASGQAAHRLEVEQHTSTRASSAISAVAIASGAEDALNLQERPWCSNAFRLARLNTTSLPTMSASREAGLRQNTHGGAADLTAGQSYARMAASSEATPMPRQRYHMNKEVMPVIDHCQPRGITGGAAS